MAERLWSSSNKAERKRRQRSGTSQEAVQPKTSVEADSAERSEARRADTQNPREEKPPGFTSEQWESILHAHAHFKNRINQAHALAFGLPHDEEPPKDSSESA